MTSRRAFAAGIAAAALAASCRRKNDEGPGATPGPSSIATNAPAATAREAMSRGIRWLAARRGDDGTWRSDVYGAFKDGWSLTPLAATALLACGAPADARPAIAWLAGAARTGRVAFAPPAPVYPVYTAALTVRALSHRDALPDAAARDAWLAELRSRQLTEALGWSKQDAHYGGWGYATVIPRKPAPGTEIADAFLESNLSATAFALDALAAAGVPAGDPAFAAARVFVEKQQNDDGGFFFVPDDDVRNKAGAVDPGAKPRRFHSYGSMTANGLRSLLLCGLAHDHPRVTAAREWLLSRFDPKTHPGTYRPEREEVRESTWFYWSAAASEAFALARVPRERWAPGFAAELMRRQRADGSWVSELVAVREDDPIVATSFALLALAAGRHS